MADRQLVLVEEDAEEAARLTAQLGQFEMSPEHTRDNRKTGQSAVGSLSLSYRFNVHASFVSGSRSPTSGDNGIKQPLPHASLFEYHVR